MKINFNSLSLGLGGGNRFILQLADALTERGHKVTITHLGQESWYHWYGEPKAEIINLNYPSLFARLLRKVYLRKHGYSYNEEAYLQSHIPDCDVNVAGYCMSAYPTLFSQKGRMFYLVQHYEPLFYPDKPDFVAKATLTYQLPMTRLCVSQWLTEKVNGVYIGNGVNLSKFKPLNLERSYDVMVMPKPNVKWKGDYQPIIKSLKDSGMKVLEVKDLSEHELIRAYNTSNLFLFLSEKEGFGYPPLEALSCGASVVSTPCTEFLVDNKNALVLPTKYSTETVLWKIKWLLANIDYKKSLVEEGFKTAKSFDFNKVVDRFQDAIT